MTIVEGQIEPLKQLKEVLDQKGITRFNSIADINAFIKNYDSDKGVIPNNIENELNNEITELESRLVQRQKTYDDLKSLASEKLHNKIESLGKKLRRATETRNSNFFYKILFYFRVKELAIHKSNLENNFEKIISEKTYDVERKLNKTKSDIKYCTENKKKIITERSEKSYKELDDIKKVVDDLYTLIAGAIGENSVVKELEKLSDDYYLFNDFSIKFNPPIYNRKDNDRIFSIQIDHLLVCNSGIFIIETKNWSKQSIKNLDLRSPVEQILRTSYALFVLLNSKSKYNKIKLKHHHWGSKQIPIRNLIVMINGKPKEEFKHVKVLSLNELNGYITYFDPIFSSEEVKSMSEYLRNKKH